MPGKYSINDLERLTGIKAHTLRIWEQRHKILHPKRTDTNIRFYSNTDLKRILNISLLNNNGYKISRIASLSDAEIIKEAEKLLYSFNGENEQIEKLVFCLMDMDARRFEMIFSDCIARFGFENTFENVLFPFLKHVGDMWQVGTINPAQEHFISNMIRQKLLGAIDATSVATQTEKKILLFLPFGEYQEIALLYCYYLGKRCGHNCIYLGASVPVEEVQFVCLNYKPDTIVTVITTHLKEGEADEYLLMLKEKMPASRFLISGRIILETEKKIDLPKNFKVFADFSSLKKLL